MRRAILTLLAYKYAPLKGTAATDRLAKDYKVCQQQTHYIFIEDIW